MAKSVSLRIQAEILQRAKKVLEALEADPKLAGVPLSQSRALVMMLVRGLQEYEADYGIKPSTGRQKR